MEFSSAIICLKKPIYKQCGDCKMYPGKHFFQRGGYWQGCTAERMHCEQNYLSQDNSLQGQTLTLHWWGKRGSQEAIEEELFEGGIGPDQLPLEDCKQLLLSERISYQHRTVRTFWGFHPDVPKVRIFPSLAYRTSGKPALNIFCHKKACLPSHSYRA